MNFKRLAAMVLATSALGLTQICLAADGVLEISQTCAAGDGCFPGDAPGFPVQILNSGSYILTSDLTVPALTHGIATWEDTENRLSEISLSIDLNGFTISSTTNCTGVPLVCSPTSTNEAYGVVVIVETGGTLTARIHSGQIDGMATGGIACQGGACVVESITLSENGFHGYVGDGVIRNAAAFKNGNTGIAALNELAIHQCFSGSNGAVGIFGRGTLEGNVVVDNPDIGITAINSVLRGNKVSGSDIGIQCDICSALENHVTSTTTAAIDFENSNSAYGGNILRSNGDAVLNAGNAVVLSPNACNTACP